MPFRCSSLQLLFTEHRHPCRVKLRSSMLPDTLLSTQQPLLLGVLSVMVLSKIVISAVAAEDTVGVEWPFGLAWLTELMITGLLKTSVTIWSPQKSWCCRRVSE